VIAHELPIEQSRPMWMRPMTSSLPTISAFMSSTFGADGRALADGDEVESAGVDVGDDGVVTDLRSERTQVEADRGRSLEPFDVHEGLEAAR
jgi:hypothetical protein